MSFPLGKIPPRILKQTVFESLGLKRKDVIIGPSEGEDAAIILMGKNLVAVHCDPISGAYSNVGWIAMNIATNDIATRGVRPSWALSCVMLPEGSRKKDLVTICKQMGKAAEKLEVSIVGGHSEVTMGLDHPLVIVTVFGLVENGKYVTTGGVKPGSKIILTKSAGIEGTAILAFDMEKPLTDKFGEEFVDKAKNFFNKLSILKEALLAFDYGGVLAMHDPTEGGVAGGLNEMADASKTGFKIYEEMIPIKNETDKICRFFKVDPLRLISSGALLIAAASEKADGIVQLLREKEIEASIIGEFLGSKSRTIIQRNGIEENLSLPLADELWKILGKKETALSA